MGMLTTILTLVQIVCLSVAIICAVIAAVELGKLEQLYRRHK